MTADGTHLLEAEGQLQGIEGIALFMGIVALRGVDGTEGGATAPLCLKILHSSPSTEGVEVHQASQL